LRRGTDIARGYPESADRVPGKQRHETAGNWGNMTGILIVLENSCSKLRSTSGKFRGSLFQHHCPHIGSRTPPSHVVITHRNRPQITLASQLDANSTNTQFKEHNAEKKTHTRAASRRNSRDIGALHRLYQLQHSRTILPTRH